MTLPTVTGNQLAHLPWILMHHVIDQVSRPAPSTIEVWGTAEFQTTIGPRPVSIIVGWHALRENYGWSIVLDVDKGPELIGAQLVERRAPVEGEALERALEEILRSHIGWDRFLIPVVEAGIKDWKPPLRA
jgi:hypothetical protein